MNRNKTKPVKVYMKQSTVPVMGNGLFAKVNIKKDSVVAEFKGKLRKSDEKLSSNRSNIYFHDESVLECYPDDLASYANDAINFTGKRRKLMKTLKKSEPLYHKHPNAKINAYIKINNNLHRAFLIASCDIAVDEEIFCHYGLIYWFKKEITKIGFLQEDEIEENGFPERLYEYPAFECYLKNFYPDYKNFDVYPFKGDYDVHVHFTDDTHLVIVLENFARQISKVLPEDLL